MLSLSLSLSLFRSEPQFNMRHFIICLLSAF